MIFINLITSVAVFGCALPTGPNSQPQESLQVTATTGDTHIEILAHDNVTVVYVQSADGIGSAELRTMRRFDHGTLEFHFELAAMEELTWKFGDQTGRTSLNTSLRMDESSDADDSAENMAAEGGFRIDMSLEPPVVTPIGSDAPQHVVVVRPPADFFTNSREHESLSLKWIDYFR